MKEVVILRKIVLNVKLKSFQHVSILKYHGYAPTL